jgi:hypothetical protein
VLAVEREDRRLLTEKLHPGETMRAVLQEYIPHAPNIGLHVAPHIPSRLLENACADYAPEVQAAQVIVLYDATLLGSAKDGALFLDDRCVVQNHDLESTQLIRYEDIVGVEERSKWFGLGGAEVSIDVNQGRATVTHSIDFSGNKEAAPYVVRALQEAMLRAGRREEGRDDANGGPPETDVSAVRAALQQLFEEGRLTREDFERLVKQL